MRIVVDTNIAFSAILNTNSLIARVILQPKSKIHFYSTDLLEFIALADHIRGKLWSGDKTLQRGLIQKGWNKFISTQELLEMTKKR